MCSQHKRTVITIFCCGLKEVHKTVFLLYIVFPPHFYMPPLSDFELSMLRCFHTFYALPQSCISIIFEITVIIALINLCLSFPCTLKHSYLDRETSLILKNIAGKPSHLLTKVTPSFACFFFPFSACFGFMCPQKAF